MPLTVLNELIVLLSGAVFCSEAGYKAFGLAVPDKTWGDIDFDSFTQWQSKLLDAAKIAAETFENEELSELYELALDDFESLLEQVLPQRP